MKKKTITIHGKELAIPIAKKRRDQLALGFELGSWDKEKHKAMWEEYVLIGELLNK